jgi:hypothetical protein
VVLLHEKNVLSKIEIKKNKSQFQKSGRGQSRHRAYSFWLIFMFHAKQPFLSTPKF